MFGRHIGGRAALLIAVLALVPFGAALVGAMPLGAMSPRPTVTCAPDTVTIATPGGARRFQVELADTPALRARGLMGRRDLAPDAGMLFLYPAPQGAMFWMKNTPLPLDMIFADSTGTITRIHPDARPFDETSIDGGKGVLAVLEVRGGTAARLGLAVGQAMAHPALPQDRAALACAR